MAFSKYLNGAWQEADDANRYEDGAWVRCDNAYRYQDGAWQEALEVEPFYLIKNGAYQVDFTEIPFWKTEGSSTVTESPSSGYVEIYTKSSGMLAIITTDLINLKKYKQINIEATAQIYLDSTSYENNAVVGAYPTIPESIVTGSPAKPRDDCMMYHSFYRLKGTISSAHKTANATVDISNLNQYGHLYMGITSWNMSNEFSRLRIYNLWLS